MCVEDLRVTEQGQWEQRDMDEFQSYVGGRVDRIPRVDREAGVGERGGGSGKAHVSDVGSQLARSSH